MTKHKRQTPAFVVLLTPVLATLSLTGCGGGGGGDGGGSPPAGSLTASAGDDQITARGAQVSLDGTQSASSTNASLSYEWLQVRGPDVTGGSGSLTGATPTFTAPNGVDTVSFELRVGAGSSRSAPDTVHINVLEHDGAAFFVDGDNGSDSNGDGSLTNPFASIAYAISEISSANVDIYVRTLPGGSRYDETGSTLSPPAETSLYGGYGVNWVRDPINTPTGVDGDSVAVEFANVSADTWFSGFDLSAESSGNASGIVSGVSTRGGAATLYIENNTITAGNVGAGRASAPASSYGLRLADVFAVQVRGNEISAGNGGTGQFGVQGMRGTNGSNGSSGSGRNAGSGGAGGFSSNNAGGSGGRGGGAFGGNGQRGEDGNSLGLFDPGGSGGSGSSSDTPGGAGGGGIGSRGGSGGRGADGAGTISTAGFFRGKSANRGSSGFYGTGGGGGGGGEGGVSSLGGGGGGGGGGGDGGDGGSGGTSGGASIGILLSGVTDTLIDGNTVTSATGGNGGSGGLGGSGGNGGNGAPGQGADSVGGGEAGGHGGGGGRGGQGGQGGGGGGGPSYAILVDRNIAPVISNNTLASSQGGDGGSGGIGGRRGASGTTGGDGGSSNASSKATDGAPSQGGWSYGILDLAPTDGLVPVLSNNTIVTGTAGERGQAGNTNF